MREDIDIAISYIIYITKRHNTYKTEEIKEIIILAQPSKRNLIACKYLKEIGNNILIEEVIKYLKGKHRDRELLKNIIYLKLEINKTLKEEDKIV